MAESKKRAVANPAEKAATKPAQKATVKPAATQKPASEVPEAAIESAINKTENFLYRNGKMLIIALLAIVLLIGAYMAYTHLYLPKRSERASAAMFVAQQNFQQQVYDVALDGDGNNLGFRDVASQFSGTPEGNLARHYAGVCLLRMGDAEGALKFLEEYKTVSGAPGAVINAQNYALRGDILSDRGDHHKAAEMYDRAVKAGDNPLTSPMYLRKLGLAYLRLGRGEESVAAFQRIVDEYPSSLERRDIEKYIGAAEQL